MKFIVSDVELERLHSAGKGFIYNDFSRRSPSGKNYNVLHSASCGWMARSNVNVPKIFFKTLDEAIEWLRKNRGEEGRNWKRCGTCRAKGVILSKSSVTAGQEREQALLIDAKNYRHGFQHFKNVDYESYPHCFGEFWKRKLRIETKGGHILDAKHMRETYDLLGRTLKRWQWHRPDSFSKLAGKLKEALKKSSDAYSQIRNYSLLEFNNIPNEPLELIWHELGYVKSKAGKNPGGCYLVMPTTKSLMFLWGQTLAFDSVVRRLMPTFGIPGLNENYWGFETWKMVMGEFQLQLKQQPEIVSLFEGVSQEEYGTDSTIPYGQFLDIHYWIRSK